MLLRASNGYSGKYYGRLHRMGNGQSDAGWRGVFPHPSPTNAPAASDIPNQHTTKVIRLLCSMQQFKLRVFNTPSASSAIRHHPISLPVGPESSSGRQAGRYIADSKRGDTSKRYLTPQAFAAPSCPGGSLPIHSQFSSIVAKLTADIQKLLRCTYAPQKQEAFWSKRHKRHKRRKRQVLSHVCERRLKSSIDNVYNPFSTSSFSNFLSDRISFVTNSPL